MRLANHRMAVDGDRVSKEERKKGAATNLLLVRQAMREDEVHSSLRVDTLQMVTATAKGQLASPNELTS
jgi:Asp-tRNA(Asn)/Glu-tRNA(Gln) amidotransferase C subunit